MATTASGRAARQTLVLDANICYPALQGGILGGLGRLGLCTTDVVVEDELERGRTFGPDARIVLNDAGVQVVIVDFDPDDYSFLSSGLTDADISCFVHAQVHDGTVLTHDARLTKDCNRFGVNVQRMSWLLSSALEEGHLTKSDVRHAIRSWRRDTDERGWYEEPDMLEVEERCR